MRQEQGRIAYPILPDPLTPHDLKRQFTPWRDEIEWAFNTTSSEETRLGLLTLLKVFETLGRFILPNEIPAEIIRHVARCAGLAERDSIEYVPRTLYRHHRKVRAFLGITEWNIETHHVAETTMEQLASARTQPADLITGAIETLVRERFELPAMSTLRRMVGIVRQRTNDSLFDVVAKHLTAAHRDTLDALLEVPKDAKESPFATLCRAPGRATATNLKALAEHVDWLATLAAPQTALVDIMPVKLEQWADEAQRMIATELKEYRAPRRHALLIVAGGQITLL